MSLTLTPVTPVLLTMAAAGSASLSVAAVVPASLSLPAASVRSGLGSYYGTAHYGADTYGDAGFLLTPSAPGALVLVPA